MKEQLIEFETAKLAKEKGFDCQTRRYYGATGIGHSSRQPISQNSIKSGGCLRVTQSLLQKWLRDEHGVIITVDYGELTLFAWWTLNVSDINHCSGFDTYEQALEVGLIEGLKLI